ncbi:FimD/PapC N-terminal domain-containing protein [Cupriavidus basilensis]
MQKKTAHPIPPRIRPLSAVAIMLVSAGALAANSDSRQAGSAAEVEFNDLFLQQPGGSPIDLGRFSKGNVVLPGDYRAELYVNQAWLGRMEVRMRETGKDSEVLPCFRRAAAGTDGRRSRQAHAGSDCTPALARGLRAAACPHPRRHRQL